MKCLSTFIIFISVIIFNSCKEKSAPVTKEQVLQFAAALEKSLKEGNASMFNDLFATDEFVQRITKATNNRGNSEGFTTGILSGIKKKRLGDEILKSIGNDGMYSLVKSYEKDGKQRLIFRMYSEEGLNYHDMELVNVGKE